MEIGAADVSKSCRKGFGCARTLLFDPLLHLLDAVAAHGCHGAVTLLAQLVGIEAGSGTKGLEQGEALGVRAIAPGKTVEHLDQAAGKQGITAKAGLTAEQVQLHKQLIHHAAIERRDHVGEGAVKLPLAVGNGEGCTHAGLGQGWSTLAAQAQ